MTRRLWIPSLLFWLSLAACSVNVGGRSSPDAAAPAASTVGVGQSCQSSPCREGLSCDKITRICTPSASVIRGGSCDLSANCVTGNYCTQLGVCEASGTNPVGANCSTEEDCQTGLVCVQSGLTGVCKPAGTLDVGRGCIDTSDCLAGLLCIGSTCNKGPKNTWAGVVCPPNDESVAKVYFRVPRAADLAIRNDFYRLPFPNDIRMKNGQIDLGGHPVPGKRILSFDLVARIIEAIQTDATGFGANQTIYLRLSRDFDATRFPGDCGTQIVDITPASRDYGLAAGAQCGAFHASSRYVCGPYLWTRPPLGHPLRPGTTYAVLVRKTIIDTLNRPFGPDDDFTAMLASAAPADPELAAAYLAYKPLRDFLANDKVLPEHRVLAGDLSAAAVFTVDKYEDPLAGIETAVTAMYAGDGNITLAAVDAGSAGIDASTEAIDAGAVAIDVAGGAVDGGAAVAKGPRISNVVRCGDPGVVSPCDDGLTGAAHRRGCLAADSASASFDEYQGTLLLPIFQQGKSPYLAPEEGGKIRYGADGFAISAGSQEVCFALTVPKGAAPASGWPLVVYAHGTAGSYRSIVDLGLAEDLAQGTATAGGSVDGGASGAPMPTAMLGYDGILHGTRSGGSTTSVGELVYNFLNPPAARDNALQAAADLFAIPLALPGFAEKGIVLDATKLSLYGHSQGGNAASLVAARPSKYGAIVMSGTGGTLAYTLTGKLQPVNIPAILPFLLGEPGAAAVDANHPVINLLQMYCERSDSVNFARRLYFEPLPNVSPFHSLHVYGAKDSFAVVSTQQAYAIATGPFGLQVAPSPPVDPFAQRVISPQSLPARLNEFFGPYAKVTALEIQYQPTDAYDGHFVSTRNPSARAAIQGMLITFARDGVPSVWP